MAISSTGIRRRVREGKPISIFYGRVEHYIYKKGLYKYMEKF